jgi:hypothetical protein
MKTNKTTKTVKAAKTKGVKFKAYPRPLRIEDIAAAFKMFGYSGGRVTKANDVHSVYIKHRALEVEMELHIDSPTSPMADDTEPFFFIEINSLRTDACGTLDTLPIKNYAGKRPNATTFVAGVQGLLSRAGVFA